MTLTRAITALHYTAAALVLGWLVVASLGWLEAGIWRLIATIPVYAAVLMLAIVECSPWHRRREHARFLAHLDNVQRRARLSACYRLRGA
jgi:hypothetical protein